MWKTTKGGKRRSYAACKLCGAWHSARSIAAHWEDLHREQWLKLQAALDASAGDSEEKGKLP